MVKYGLTSTLSDNHHLRVPINMIHTQPSCSVKSTHQLLFLGTSHHPETVNDNVQNFFMTCNNITGVLGSFLPQTKCFYFVWGKDTKPRSPLLPGIEFSLSQSFEFKIGRGPGLSTYWPVFFTFIVAPKESVNCEDTSRFPIFTIQIRNYWEGLSHTLWQMLFPIPQRDFTIGVWLHQEYSLQLRLWER